MPFVDASTQLQVVRCKQGADHWYDLVSTGTWQLQVQNAGQRKHLVQQGYHRQRKPGTQWKTPCGRLHTTSGCEVKARGGPLVCWLPKRASGTDGKRRMRECTVESCSRANHVFQETISQGKYPLSFVCDRMGAMAQFGLSSGRPTSSNAEKWAWHT